MDEFEMLKEKCRALEDALAAAHVETAKVELRAKELVTGLERVLPYAKAFWRAGETPGDCITNAKALLAAAPDSDARLREVMERVTHRGIVCGESRGSAGIYDEKSRENDVKFIVDEALGVKS